MNAPMFNSDDDLAAPPPVTWYSPNGSSPEALQQHIQENDSPQGGDLYRLEALQERKLRYKLGLVACIVLSVIVVVALVIALISALSGDGAVATSLLQTVAGPAAGALASLAMCIGPAIFRNRG